MAKKNKEVSKTKKKDKKIKSEKKVKDKKKAKSKGKDKKGKKAKKDKTVKKITPVTPIDTSKEASQKTAKLSLNDNVRIATTTIRNLRTIKQVEDYIAGDERITVKKIATSRINAINNIK